MAKIAFITDTHWGCRNDSVIFARHISRFYSEIFFPYIDDHGIDAIIHLGDIVDRRKYINYVTAKALHKDFIEPIQDRGLNLHAIIGNHDTYFKNTNEINSMDVLYGKGSSINYYSSPTEIDIDDCLIALVPWICTSNSEESFKFIRETRAQVLLGHLELAGFEMYKGSSSDNGYDPLIFSRFDVVCSGHFHHKSNKGNVHYLGAPYEMTWSDYDDPRGFHIFDTRSRSLEFIKNPNNIFIKLFYDDTDISLHDVIETDFSRLKDCVVKVIIKNKNNPHIFDVYIEQVEKAGVADLQIVEDHLNLNLELEDDILNEAEDTLSILNRCVSQMSKDDHKDLQKLIQSLYAEALMVE